MLMSVTLHQGASTDNKLVLGDKTSLLPEVEDVARSFAFGTEVLSAQLGSGDNKHRFRKLTISPKQQRV